MSMLAASADTPGLSRAITPKLKLSPRPSSSSFVNAMGTHNCAGWLNGKPRSGNSKLAGITPITVCGTRLIEIVRPTMWSSPPNARCQIA